MIWLVARKELLSNLTSPKVLITFAVCAVLIPASILAGAVNYLGLKEEATIQSAAERDRLRSIASYQEDFMLKGVNLYRWPAATSILVSGVDGDSARRGNANVYFPPQFSVSKFNSTPILAVFGLLDLSFIVKVILSLFAILFTYDAISGEKEGGTLRQALSNQVKRSQYIIGKLVGNLLLLLIPFFIPLLIGLLILQFIPGIAFSAGDWARTALILLAFVLYLIAFYSLGMTVSALTKRTAVSFLALLMLWVLFIAILPRLSVMTAQALRPVNEIAQAKREYGSQAAPLGYQLSTGMNDVYLGFYTELRNRTPRKPLIQTLESQADYERKVREFQSWQEEATVELNNQMKNLFDKYARDLRALGDKIDRSRQLDQERQNQIAIMLTRLGSPAGALTMAVSRLAGSGVYSSDKAFRTRVEEYVPALLQLHAETVKKDPRLVNYGYSPKQSVDLSSGYPDLSGGTEEPLDVSLGASLQDLAYLALFAIVFMAIAYVAFLRYDAR
jgi:ABC-type transport system involved in multi-copper enzyme maturation permease subunit